MAALLTLCTAAAQAQLGVDTELSPEAKPVGSPGPASQWAVLGGAEYGSDGELVKFSETPATVDFFTTSFSPNYVGDAATGDAGNPEGFFGGAECIEETEPTDEALSSCTRRPAIYRYYLDAVGDPQIEKVDPAELLGPTEAEQERQGFVGAIAWLDGERALAVGGTLEYPRREPAAVSADEIKPGETYDEAYARKDAEQGAGMARAWVYDDDDGDGVAEAEDADGISHWRELDDLADGAEGDEIPAEMGALAALACAPEDMTDSGGETVYVPAGTCWAGGMQQLWSWGPTGRGPAAEGFDDDPVTGLEVTRVNSTKVNGIVVPTDPRNEPDFHYRVRQIRTNPLTQVGSNEIFVAVTSGCCAGSAAGVEPGAGTQSLAGARLLTYAQRGAARSWKSESFSPLTAEETGGAGGSLPESYYGVVFGARHSAIASPGGQAVTAEEPGSRIVTRVGSTTQQSRPDLAGQRLDAVRLLAADGDFLSTDLPVSDWEPSGGPQSDSVLDWAVGSSKEGSGEGTAQGLAYTTVESILPLPRPVTCEVGISGFSPEEGCELAPENLTEHRFDTSTRLVEFPTYALNALSFVPGTNGREGWAAGDRGALARLGGGGAIGGGDEPPAPSLLPGRPAALADRGPFEPSRPASAEPGAVPPLAAQPFEALPERTLVPYGTADASRPYRGPRIEEITALAMSRDGSEGWAVGSGTKGKLALQHFDGERWVRCDPEGLGGAFEPDPACASLRTEGLTLHAIARIPLERDDDPTNDDEFEAVAVGSVGNTGTLLRYANGAWAIDETANGIEIANNGAIGADVAFRSPDEGWMATSRPALYRYVGDDDEVEDDGPAGRWVRCDVASPPPECGAGASSIPRGTSVADLQLQLAGETTFVAGTRMVGSGATGVPYPFVFSIDISAAAPTWRAEYDPGPDEDAAPEAQGSLDSFSVAELGEGEIAGWLLGRFGQSVYDAASSSSDDLIRAALGPGQMLMRRDPEVPLGSQEAWSFHEATDAADDLLPFAPATPQLFSFSGAGGVERSFILPVGFGPHQSTSSAPLEYDPETARWRVLPAPFVSSTNISGAIERATQGTVTAAAPDNQGGLWLTALSGTIGSGQNSHFSSFFYHYADRRRQAVFEDAPSPVDAPISDLDGSADGTVWVSTESDRLHRYDRVGGWETVRIPGWDRGRVVTRPSKALAVAVNDSGVGIAVGEDGRIADITPSSVALDPASARRCSDTGGAPPCGTPRDLIAAEVAPDGSAMAGGERATLTWRPAGGEFRLIDAPRISTSTTITDISMPTSGRAWVTTSVGSTSQGPRAGEIWAGTQVGERWRWVPESAADAAQDELGFSGLNAIEVDSSGRGLAVGYRGAMLERSPDGGWTRLETGFLDDLYSVELPPGGYGDGALVGGALGVILTRTEGSFHLARQGDPFEPLTTGSGNGSSAQIVGVSLAGGDSTGDVEAWAASQVETGRQPRPYALFHYGTVSDALLAPAARAEPLPDASEPNQGELSVAAFGRSECHLGNCPPFLGANLFNEVISRRIRAELAERRERTGEALAATFTGEINSAPGRDDERNLTVHSELDANISHDQWRELAAEPLMEDGIAVFGSPGERDLSAARGCSGFGHIGKEPCPDPRELAPTGTTTQWRETFADMPAPWGTADPYSAHGYEYRPVEGSLPKVDTSSTTGEQSANTHYALDVVREQDDESLARLVFADTSNARSLAASDANQNPLEPQEAWLEEVLCQEGSAADTAALDCTRPDGLPAVVVTTTPTYSYGPGGVDGTQAEAASFESLLLRHEVTALVAGHLGWNGLYYTFAPGLHYPPPGGAHPDSESPPGSAAGAEAPSGPLGQQAPDPQELASGTGATGLLPSVVASSAGGLFGPRGGDEGSAADGFWHGYSVIRIPADGDPSKVIVEQRPILDWVGITARDHVIAPRQRMTLDGFGREPLGIDTSVRMLEIDSYAITHRYDLLLANPDQPWLPCLETDSACTALNANLAKEEASEENPCAPYLCLPKRIGTVEKTTGQVRAGNGQYPETFALGMLSVGSKAATYPIVFERSPSFVVRSALRTPGTPPLNNVPTPKPPGPPPIPDVPQIPKIDVPAIPPPPAIPNLSATAPPEPTPPTPPAPPPPSQQPAPLDLSVAPPGVSISTPTALIQPPTPPVNPAPPGGARREARQRQAAAQKGGADSSEDKPEAMEGGGDSAEGRPGSSAMTRLDASRHDRIRPSPSFTALAQSEQASAWSRGALYGGGLAFAALVLAFSWATLRPTPRRRGPEVPAPARSTARSYPR